MINQLYVVTGKTLWEATKTTLNLVEFSTVNKNPSLAQVVVGDAAGLTIEYGVVIHSRDSKPGTALRPENAAAWYRNTAPIVGVFLDPTAAAECIKSGNLTPWDQRWVNESRSAIRAISDHHPWITLGLSLAKTHLAQELLRRDPAPVAAPHLKQAVLYGGIYADCPFCDYEQAIIGELGVRKCRRCDQNFEVVRVLSASR
jgi:hypothetical protein